MYECEVEAEANMSGSLMSGVFNVLPTPSIVSPNLSKTLPFYIPEVLARVTRQYATRSI